MLLQANLLQPLTDVSTIRLRYDVVEELLGSEELACSIGQCMTSLPNNMDKMCSGLVSPVVVGQAPSHYCSGQHGFLCCDTCHLS